MTYAGRLPTTRWSLILRAGETSNDPRLDQTARQSLEELCEVYWPALYGYLRRRGRSRQDSEDLIQGFFTDLLERKSIATVDETRGRFRAFLYASLDHYVANVHRHENAIRRGGDISVLSMNREKVDAAEREIEHQGPAADQIAGTDGDPANLFDREWAACLIRQTLADLEKEYAAKGKAEWFALLSPMLTSSDFDSEQRKQIAHQLGLSSTAMKVAVHRLRVAYRQKLTDAVSQTVDSPQDCGRERQWLFEALG